MSASVKILKLTGAQSGTPTKTDVTGTNVRATTSDVVSTNDTTSPIKIPPSSSGGYNSGSQNFSFWQILRLQCRTAPSTKLQNLKFYTDGTNSYGTGVTCAAARVAGTNSVDTGYKQGSGTASVSGDQLTAAFYNAASGSGQPKGLTNPDGLSAGLLLGQQTLSSLTSSSTTATATCPSPHNLVSGQQVTIAGAAPSGYNGTYVVTVTSSTQFTYTLSGSLGASSGTITMTPIAANAFLFTSVAPLSLSGSFVTGTDTIWNTTPNDPSGSFGDLLVYQLAADNTASPGVTPVQETLTLQYDES